VSRHLKAHTMRTVLTKVERRSHVHILLWQDRRARGPP
jgi:hypothetical protein